MSEAEIRLRLEASTSGLADRVPLVSARSLVSKGQRNLFFGLVFLFLVGVVVSARVTFTALTAIFTLIYLIAVVYRIYLFIRSSRIDGLEVVTDEEALSVPEADLPFYTIMIPAYREASVMGKLIDNVSRFDYPMHRLEVLLLVEQDDDETLEVLRDIEPGPSFKLVVVPPGEPRTKPKALNFGLTLARGEVIAVYDVEDTPDVLQLRRAAVALARFGPEVACIQAKLSYGNASQNFITRSFTIEYTMWYSFFLPGLSSMHAPIPLGGTSNHFRRAALRALGGWDPYNVTEDCDLGIRMFREGYDVKVLDSVTLEEANSDFVNWVKQRSRWYKGYLQTFLIHLRSPRRGNARDPLAGRGSPHRLCGRDPDPGRGEPDFLDSHHRLVRGPPSVPARDFPGARLLRGCGTLGVRQLSPVVSHCPHGPPYQSARAGLDRNAGAGLLGHDVDSGRQSGVAAHRDPVVLGEDHTWAQPGRRGCSHRDAAHT